MDLFITQKGINNILKNLLIHFSDKRLDLHLFDLEGNNIIPDAYKILIAHFASDAGKKGPLQQEMANCLNELGLKNPAIIDDY